ncbi:MAG: noc [Clostridia bacterium]|jgi:ParB family chromosome partitioning protein|nr:noc [Clostridia bacterium]
MFEMLEKDRKKLREIPIDCIISNPSQPRKTFNTEELLELSESIREVGVIQPLTVRYHGDGIYALIAGERRLRASCLAGMKSVPCIIVDVGEEDSALLALIENLQRKDLDFFEEANGIAFLINLLNLTQSEAAQKIGKSQPAVANKLRLLKIPKELQKIIIENSLTERHARALLKLNSFEHMKKAVEESIRQQMNVSELEAHIERIINKPEIKSKPLQKGFCRDLRLYFNTINHAVSLMKNSGINAGIEKTEDDEKIVYKIVVKKNI